MPAVRLVYVLGDVHGSAGAPSSEHSIVAPGIVLAKANVAVVESVGSAGACVKSTPMPIVHSCSCQATSRLPAGIGRPHGEHVVAADQAGVRLRRRARLVEAVEEALERRAGIAARERERRLGAGRVLGREPGDRGHRRTVDGPRVGGRRRVLVAGGVDGAHAEGVLAGGQLEQLERGLARVERRAVERAVERRADLRRREGERGVRVACQRQRVLGDRRVGRGDVGRAVDGPRERRRVGLDEAELVGRRDLERELRRRAPQVADRQRRGARRRRPSR